MVNGRWIFEELKTDNHKWKNNYLRNEQILLL